MENAARGMWEGIEALFMDKKAESILAGRPLADLSFLALVGPGNNGGDALAVLRHAWFAGCRRLEIILLPGEPSPANALQFASTTALGIKAHRWIEEEEEARTAIARADAILDGISGTGLRGQLRPESAALVEAVNAAAASVVALDLPSGLGDAYRADFPILEADWTLCVEPLKAALFFPSARLAVGEIIPVSGVFPFDAVQEAPRVLLAETDLARLLKRLPVSAHKGLRGRLGLFAGCPGMVGAADLAAKGAYAASVGLVTLYADDELFPVLSRASGPSSLASSIIRPLSDVDGGLSSLDSLLVGPGWGRGGERLGLLRRILEEGIPTVLDADGIRLFGELLSKGFKPRGLVILTPHPGEFSAISGLSVEEILANPLSILPDFAKKNSVIVLLKSHVTWLASPDGRLAVWDGLEPSLAVAGSGDVLAGLVAGLVAGKCARMEEAGEREAKALADIAWESSCLAVMAHGWAGRRARLHCGNYEAPEIAREAGKLLDPEKPFL